MSAACMVLSATFLLLIKLMRFGNWLFVTLPVSGFAILDDGDGSIGLFIAVSDGMI